MFYTGLKLKYDTDTHDASRRSDDVSTLDRLDDIVDLKNDFFD